MSFVARRSQAVLLFVALALFSAASAFGQCNPLALPAGTSYWDVPAGNWSLGTNWLPLGVPAAGNSICLTNGTNIINATTTLDTNATISNLNIGGFNTLNFNNGINLTVNPGSTITNGNLISLNGAGAATFLYLGNAASTTTLTGGGTLTLADTAHNTNTYIYGDGNVTLNNVNNLIQGEGEIGVGHAMALSNGGTINANSTGQTLFLNPADGIVNTGTLEATNGGFLQISETTNNSGGTITTDNGHGSQVQLVNGSDIQGGTISGTGVQTLAGHFNPTLDGVTHGQVNITGTFTVVDDSAINLAVGSTINNTGTIALKSAGNATQFYIGNGAGTVTLKGGGTVTLSNTAHNSAAEIFGDGNSVLDNVNNLIQGEGQIGVGRANSLTNEINGTVNANSSGQTLFLNPANGVSNAGTLTATNGGILQIDVKVNNNPNSTVTGGLISTDSGHGSAVQLVNGSDIQGGTLNGNVTTVAGHFDPVLDGATQGQLTNAGTITVVNDSAINLSNASFGTNGTVLNNTGAINLTAAGSGTELYAGNGAGTTKLTGGGTITLSDTSHASDAIIYGDGNVTLENVNNTIQGEGDLGLGHAILIQNDAAGIINANSSGQVLELITPDGVINKGLIEATLGGILDPFTTITNTGATISTDSGHGSLINLDNATDIIGGTLSGTVKTIGGNLNPTLDGFTHGAATFSGTMTVVDDSAINFTPGSTINNTGAINLTSVGDGTYLYAGNGNTNGNTILQGGGTVTMSNTLHNGAAGLYGDGNVVLENVNNLIQGEGDIGFGHAVVFQNDAAGVVNANVSGQVLLLDTPDGVINKGLIEATVGGILNAYTTITNTGGTITTDSGHGSVINLNNSTDIIGGTLSGTSQTVAGNFNPTLDGITHGALNFSGTMTVVDDSAINFASGSTINNTGAINLTSTAGNGTYLYAGNTTANGTTILKGGGTVTMSGIAGNVNAGIYGDGNVVLENVNNLIQGQGSIGFGHAFVFQNDAGGTVNANVSGQALLLDPADTMVNKGLMEATGGGILEAFNTINNQGGTISTDSGHVPASVVLINNSTDIQGGTLNGNVQTVTGNFNPTLDGITHGALTNAGAITAVNNSAVNFANGSTINNTGSIALNSTGNNTQLYFGNSHASGNVMLTGGGTVTLSDTTHGGNAEVFGDGNATLENVNNTIQGEGQIGLGHANNIINDVGGTILANSPGQTLTINPSGQVTNNGTFQVNAGSTLTVTNAATLTNFGGGVLTGGTYIVNGATGNTGTMQLSPLGNNAAGEISNNAATIVLNGPTANTLFVDAGGHNLLTPLNTNTGSLTVEGGYNFNYGTVGAITNLGTVTVGTGSTFQVAGGGALTVYDQIGGTTQGTGTVIAGISNINGGALLPGASTANPGTLSFTGNLGIGAVGSLSEGITGTGAGQFGVTNVSGTLNINGSASLNITNAAGLVVPIGTQLTIMTSSSLPVGSGFTGVASGATFDSGLETWTVGKVGNNEVLNATLSPGQVITATWSGPSGNWTTTNGSAPILTSNWTCNVPIVNFSGNDCVPNNGAPATAAYAAVLNSPGHTMTLGPGDTPSNPIVNNVTVQAGTLDIQSGANLQLTAANNGGFNQTGGTTTVDGTLSTFAGGANITGGTLEGTGSVNGNTITVGAGATLLPGDGVTSPGTLTFANNLTLGGTLDEVLNSGSSFGLLSVGQGFTLNSGSVLDILQAAGFSPTSGETLTIATAGSPVTGTFSTVLGQNFSESGNPWSWKVLYNQSGDNIELQANPVNPASVTATWGPVPNSANTSGEWTTATEWGCAPGPVNCVPNNGGGTTYAAILDSTGNTLTLSSADGPITVNSVDIQAGTLALSGGSLTAANSFTVEANGVLSGNGTVTSPSFTNSATANPNGVVATGGTLDLSGSTITNLSGTTLNGGAWTAGGGGVAGTLKLPSDIVTNNSGLLFLDQPGSQITDSANANALAGLTSNNTGAHLGIFDGATLSITPGGGTFTNNGSFLNSSFGGSALTINGNLTNSGGSGITVNGNFGGASLTVNGNLSNLDTSTITLSNSGLLTVSNAAGPTITNNGTISDGGTLALTDSGKKNTGTLQGTGTLTLQGGSLTFAADMGFVSTSTINGNGTISGGTEGTTNFNNRGTLMPTTGTITLNSDFNNDGTVTVNTGNTLLIDAGSHIGNSTFQNATIMVNGGTLTDNSTNGFGNGLANGFTGTITIQGGGTGTIGGELFNGPFGGATGAVTVTGAGSNLTLTGGLDDGACLSGCGTGHVSVLAGGLLTSGNSVFIANDAGSTGTLLINGAGSELNTTGNNVTIGTNGTVTVSAGGTLLTNNGGITTTGTVTVGNGGTISMGTGDYTQNAGTTTIDAGGVIDPTNYFVNGGTTEVNGSLTANTVSVANGAELTGNGGTITGNLINDGTLSPGTGAAPGTLTVNGNVNLTGATGLNDGTFLELIAGLNNFGVLDDTAANGLVTLGGTLDVVLLGGYQPVVGNTFTFIDPFADLGTFTTLDLPNAPAGDEYIVSYNPGGVQETQLCFVSSANPVCGASSTGPPPAVPEPKSVVLLGTVIVAALWFHRKRRQNLAAKA